MSSTVLGYGENAPLVAIKRVYDASYVLILDIVADHNIIKTEIFQN